MTVHPPTKQFLANVPRASAGFFAPIQREFDRLFDQLGAGWSSFAELEAGPRMDVRDAKDAFEISLEVPGMTRDQVEITVDDGILTIKGEKKAETERTDGEYRISERTYGAFERSIALPSNVDAEKLAATLKDGVLKLTAPKDGQVKAKTIAIQPAA